MTDAEKQALREQISPLFELSKVTIAELEAALGHAVEMRDRAQAVWDENGLGG